MTKFILNNQTIESDLPKGVTVLDFVRYHKNLKGTKIGCREGDCGACTILVGEIGDDALKYRTQTSCLMPLANAAGKHIVTIEGINRADGELTEVQHAMVEESGTQCGFCTVGFVVSLTAFCLEDQPKTAERAVSAIDGNICRCTGYKSIERACARIAAGQQTSIGNNSRLKTAIEREIVPEYFAGIKERLLEFQIPDSGLIPDSRFQIPNWKVQNSDSDSTGGETNLESGIWNLESAINPQFLAGGTDLYVQRPEEMTESDAANLFDNASLRFITETEEAVELGASVVVTDLLESGIFQKLFPNLYKHLKLVSSTPIRNMATLAGNFVNASPIGDMTAWFLALDAEIVFNTTRVVHLRDFYLGYKKLAKEPDEFITKIRFSKDFTDFNFEKVCKRTYLDIASVNTAISLKTSDNLIETAHVSAGGVFATPLYLRATSEFLRGKTIDRQTVEAACEIIQTEIAPISDVRGSENYKRLLLRQLFTAHFAELFDITA